MSHIPYAQTVGCFIYVMVCTRPDIAQAINVVSKYMSNLRKEHLNAAKQVMRYLKGTTRFEILYSHGACNLIGFMD